MSSLPTYIGALLLVPLAFAVALQILTRAVADYRQEKSLRNTGCGLSKTLFDRKNVRDKGLIIEGQAALDTALQMRTDDTTKIVLNLKRIQADKVNFVNFKFYNCSFDFACRDCDFNSVAFEHCQFIGTTRLLGTLQIKSFNSATFDKCEFSNAHIQKLDRAKFVNCKLDNLSIGTLFHCTFEWSDVSGLVFGRGSVSEAVSFVCCYGLGRITGSPRSVTPDQDDISWPQLDWIDRWLDWDRLRFIGRLPLFAVSYLALLATPVVFYLIAIEHAGVRHARAVLDAVPAAHPLHDAAAVLQSRLIELPLPALSFWLFIGTVYLALGSTAFLASPTRIRHFSYQQWRDEIRGSPVNYLPLAWSRGLFRMLTAILMLIGGGLAGGVVLIKLWQVGTFILRHGGAPHLF
jgi:uncharacterized protein YjbI with pentapeptide repeats